MGGADLWFIVPQTDTSRSCKTMNTGPVCHTVCLFTPPAYTAVPNYTAWWQRHVCVNNLPKVALDSAAAGIETAISSRKSNALTTTPPACSYAFAIKMLCCTWKLLTMRCEESLSWRWQAPILQKHPVRSWIPYKVYEFPFVMMMMTMTVSMMIIFLYVLVNKKYMKSRWIWEEHSTLILLLEKYRTVSIESIRRNGMKERIY